MGVISSVPFLNLLNCCCCAGILGGGVLAVFFYKNHFLPEMPPMTSGDCLSVGASSGVVGAFVSFFLSGILIFSFGDIAKDFFLSWFRNQDFPMPPGTFEEIERELLRTEALFSFWNLLFSLIIYPLFGMFGGLIGWGIFKPKQIVYVQQGIQTPQQQIPQQTSQENPPSEIGKTE